MQKVIDESKILHQAYTDYLAGFIPTYNIVENYMLGSNYDEAKKCVEAIEAIELVIYNLENHGLKPEDPLSEPETWKKLSAAYDQTYLGINTANWMNAVVTRQSQNYLRSFVSAELTKRISVPVEAARLGLEKVAVSDKQLRTIALSIARELATGDAQPAFAAWINDNRKSENYWIFAGVEELIKTSRGNTRFKFMNIVETQKDAAVGASRVLVTSPNNGAHSAVIRFGLQTTASMTLKEVFERLGAKYREIPITKNLKSLVAETKRGVVLVDFSKCGSPIDFTLSRILSTDANPPSNVTGLNPEVIKFYDTVVVRQRNTTMAARDNVVIRGETNEWYVLETIDGVTYRLGTWLDSPIIPVVRIYGLVKWYSTRSEKYAEICAEKIQATITPNRLRLVLGSYAESAPQDTSSAGISEAITTAILDAINSEIRTIRPSTYDQAVEVVQDSEVLFPAILKVLFRVVGPTAGLPAETALPRAQKYAATCSKFMSGYLDQWRAVVYDPKKYDGSSSEAMTVFLGAVRAVVLATIESMNKNSFWDMYLTSLKDFAFAHM